MGGGKNKVFIQFHFGVKKIQPDERIPHLVSNSNRITFDPFWQEKRLKTGKIGYFASFFASVFFLLKGGLNFIRFEF